MEEVHESPLDARSGIGLSGLRGLITPLEVAKRYRGHGDTVPKCGSAETNGMIPPSSSATFFQV